MERSFMRAACEALACATLLVTTSAIFSSSPSNEPPKYCTVFTHIVKSGGSSIKSQLVRESVINGNRRPGLITGVSRTTPSIRSDTAHNASVIVGYGEQLRNTLDGIGRKCSYFTMLRHPIDRLVSMFYYCPADHDTQSRPSKFCGNLKDAEDSLESRLLNFAHHIEYGNTAFLNLMQSTFCSPSFETAICDPNRALEFALWPKDLTTTEGRDAHLEAMKTLSTYTAIGIFEEWELSMQLFDATVTGPVSQWDAEKAVNIGLRTPEREALLDWAHISPDLCALLAPDLLLYQFALLNFRQQTRDVLGKVWD